MGLVPLKSYALKTHSRVCVIRSAEVEDAPFTLELVRGMMAEKIYGHLLPEEVSRTLDQERETIQKQTESLGCLSIVAEVDAKVVGALDFSNGNYNRTAHVGYFGITIFPDYREAGIGGLLLSTVLEWAKYNPLIEKISLRVHATNRRALRLYQKYGFEQEALLKNDLKYGQGEYVDTLILSKFVT